MYEFRKMLIAHLSDPHLRPRGALYKGVADANTMFAAAVSQLNSMFPRPDLVILSGDLVDEGTQTKYAVARDLLARIAQPLLLIPSNLHVHVPGAPDQEYPAGPTSKHTWPLPSLLP